MFVVLITYWEFTLLPLSKVWLCRTSLYQKMAFVLNITTFEQLRWPSSESKMAINRWILQHNRFNMCLVNKNACVSVLELSVFCMVSKEINGYIADYISTQSWKNKMIIGSFHHSTCQETGSTIQHYRDLSKLHLHMQPVQMWKTSSCIQHT